VAISFRTGELLLLYFFHSTQLQKTTRWHDRFNNSLDSDDPTTCLYATISPSLPPRLDARLSPGIIGLVFTRLPVSFRIERLGKPQADIALQNGASSDTRFSSVNALRTRSVLSLKAPRSVFPLIDHRLAAVFPLSIAIEKRARHLSLENFDSSNAVS